MKRRYLAGIDFDADLATADDDTIRAALAEAEVPALLPAVAAATGDRTYIPRDLRPTSVALFDPTAGLSEDQHARARELAFEALVRLRDGVAAGPPDQALRRELLAYVVGDEDVEAYVEVLDDELNLGSDPRTPSWRAEDLAPGRELRVAIIGAGMSGIVAAHRLGQAGIDVTLFEKNDDVGGTWLENHYPGCRVDVSNLLYSYSFAQRDDWPEHHSSQPVLLDYFRTVARDTGVHDRIRFGTEVTASVWDDAAGTWTVHTRDEHGEEDTFVAHAVISAVGQLNRPSVPAIAGADEFAGAAFHSARWDHDVDLTGKRVAVIGTGASAVQFIPEIARDAAHLTVFQRTPAWFLPAADYTQPIGAAVRWLRTHVPGYTHWSRFWVFWRNVEGLMPLATVDPEWDGDGRSVSADNDVIREFLTAYLHDQFKDRPDLLDKVLPAYPPFAKRFIFDDGRWAEALKRTNVELVTEPVERIDADGVRTVDGAHHDVDVLVYGTGFAASDFLTPMRVTGRNRLDLHEHWGGDARAHLGITLPGFPNFFMLYGPNTNIVVNGSIIFFSECATHHIVGCIRELLASGATALDTTVEAHEEFNRAVDAANDRMAWGVSSVNTWYRNRTGRVAQNWPFTLLDYWQRTRAPRPGDHELIHVAADAAGG